MEIKPQHNYSAFAHLSGLAGYVFPLGNIIAPFVLWLFMKDRNTAWDNTGRAVINFQLSMFLYGLVLLLLSTVSNPLDISASIVYFMVISLILMKTYCIIVATNSAFHGKPFDYPLTIKFLS